MNGNSDLDSFENRVHNKPHTAEGRRRARITAYLKKKLNEEGVLSSELHPKHKFKLSGDFDHVH